MGLLTDPVVAAEAENTRLREGLSCVKAGLLNLVEVYEGLTADDYKRSCRLLVKWCDAALGEKEVKP